MSKSTQETFWRVAGTVATALLVSGLTLAGQAYAKAQRVDMKLDTATYYSDRRLDSLNRSSDHAVLIRLDERVGKMYCATVPAPQREGCR